MFNDCPSNSFKDVFPTEPVIAIAIISDDLRIRLELFEKNFREFFTLILFHDTKTSASTVLSSFLVILPFLFFSIYKDLGKTL